VGLGGGESLSGGADRSACNRDQQTGRRSSSRSSLWCTEFVHVIRLDYTSTPYSGVRRRAPWRVKMLPNRTFLPHVIFYPG
jgi:hypothetical protein